MPIRMNPSKVIQKTDRLRKSVIDDKVARILRLARWAGFPARREASRRAGKLRGRGLAMYLEWTGALPAGTRLDVSVAYDNSAANPRNPHQPPQRVRGGNRATDEMAHLWLQVLPRGGQDAQPVQLGVLAQPRPWGAVSGHGVVTSAAVRWAGVRLIVVPDQR